jgi:hypothetical protein
LQCLLPSRTKEERVNIGTVRNAPTIPDNYSILPVSARKQKPYQKIQGTTDPAVEDLRKQIIFFTEIVTKQEQPSASASAW